MSCMERTGEHARRAGRGENSSMQLLLSLGGGIFERRKRDLQSERLGFNIQAE